MALQWSEAEPSASAIPHAQVPVFRWPFGRPRRHDRFTLKQDIPKEVVELAALSSVELLARLGTSARGISEDEAVRRRGECGDNRIAHEEHDSLPVQLLRRLLNPLNVLLIVLAGISLGMGDRESALIISLMVVLSLSLAIFQERRSGRAPEKLRAMVHTTATVVRTAEALAGAAAREAREIPIEELAPGDVVRLSAGDMIPADLPLLTAKDLFINQAALTGESLPIEKHGGTVSAARADLACLQNVCFMGTTVVSGTATDVIALTGEHAYFGGLAHTIAGERPLTSLDKGINHFAWLMIRFILVMAALVFLIRSGSTAVSGSAEPTRTR